MGIGSGILGFGTTRAAGEIAAGEAETQAQAEELAATQREADRKRELSEALASQNAAAGAGGIAAFEGSPLSVMQEDMRLEAQDTQRDIFQSEMAAKTLRSQGKIAKKQAKTAANIGLLTDVASIAALSMTGTPAKAGKPAPVVDLSTKAT